MVSDSSEEATGSRKGLKENPRVASSFLGSLPPGIQRSRVLSHTDISQSNLSRLLAFACAGGGGTMDSWGRPQNFQYAKSYSEYKDLPEP